MSSVAGPPALGVSVPGAVAPDGGSPFAARLAQERDTYNALLARARTLGADRDELAAAVRELRPAVDPLAAQLSVAAFGATCDALVETVARLVATRRWRTGSMERWATLEVAPRAVPWLEADAAATVAALVDAARPVGARGDGGGWGRRVVTAALASGPSASEPSAAEPTVAMPTATDIRGAVLVAAWRSGLVRYRQAALVAGRTLPRAVAAAALDLPSDVDVVAVLDQHEQDPWWWPGAMGTLGTAGAGTDAPGATGATGAAATTTFARFGGFRGFGGPWLTLPQVVAPLPGPPGLRWRVRTPEPLAQDWTIVCDVHGSAVLRSSEGSEPGDAPPGIPAPLDAPPGAPWDDEVTGAAVTTTPTARLTLVSRAHSYSVDLVGAPLTSPAPTTGAA